MTELPIHGHHHDHHQDEPAAKLIWRRLLQAGITAGLAAYFAVDLLWGDGLRNYINIELEWLIVLAAMLFVMLAAAALWECSRLLLGKGGGHAHGRLSTLGLLAIPLLLAALSPNVPLGADAARGRLSTSVQPGGFQSLQRDPLSYNILEWLRAFSREADLANFDGQEANLLGFVYRELDDPEDIFLLARITLSCCVADASAIGLPVRYEGAATLAADQWVQVRGHFLLGEFGAEMLPILEVEELTLTEPPDQPYLYP